ncbi:hypothetical protein IscW_ISCW013003 [Ixodes scapularis]|uniref:Uncharacterized protein n=1 Tax=Ixodes scapularis TaxID=6945 RepID=B7QC89_IXOSC|nr:hypothetical protein IscW_ISCW013003 [Ixodes scapularis]|eukprot:XP_002413153.1 hypothetical protein IscW_ISCW013003 [Ixodes scapularis]
MGTAHAQKPDLREIKCLRMSSAEGSATTVVWRQKVELVATEANFTGQVVLCHLNLSAFHRADPYRYTVLDVPVNSCTHVVYPLHGLDDWFEDMLNYDAYQRASHPGLYTDMQYIREQHGLPVHESGTA